MRPVMRSQGAGSIPLAPLTIAAQAITALVIAIFLFTSSGVQLPFVDRTKEVSALVTDAAGLDASDHPQVTVGGVKAGTVTKVRYDAGSGRSRITMRLDHGIADKLFADARVRLLPRSALQDLVVDIDPGDPAAGRMHGSVITRSAPAPIGYDRVLGVFDADTRAYIQVLTGTLRQVLAGREGPLAAALRRLPDTSDASRQVATQLASRRSDLSRLVADLDRVAAATGRRGADLTHAIRVARRTLAVTEARQRELAAGIGALPGVAGQATRTFTSVHQLSTPLNTALRRLRPGARAMPGAMRAMRALLPTLRGTMRDTEHLGRTGTAPLRSLERALGQLGPAARELSHDVPYIASAVDEASKDKHGIGALVDNWSGALSSQNGFATELRSKVLGSLPIAPAAFGLSSSPASRAKLANAVAALRRVHPDLVPRAGSASLELIATRALLNGLCVRRSAGACQLLSVVQAHPPKVLRP